MKPPAASKFLQRGGLGEAHLGNYVLNFFFCENVSEIKSGRSGMVPKTSLTLLGHFWARTFVLEDVKMSRQHDMSRRPKTDLLETLCF